MDIANTPTEDIANIIYPYELGLTTRYRNEAIELLKQKDFDTARRECSQYINIEKGYHPICSTDIDGVIKELQDFKVLDDYHWVSITPTVERDEDDEFVGRGLCVSYSIFTIVEYKRCESLAKHYAKMTAWEIKHQPNSLKGKAGLELLNKILNNV